MAKCRGCGEGTESGHHVDGGPGPMHCSCEIKRLDGLASEQMSIANQLVDENDSLRRQLESQDQEMRMVREQRDDHAVREEQAEAQLEEANRQLAERDGEVAATRLDLQSAATEAYRPGALIAGADKAMRGAKSDPGGSILFQDWRGRHGEYACFPSGPGEVAVAYVDTLHAALTALAGGDDAYADAMREDFDLMADAKRDEIVEWLRLIAQARPQDGHRLTAAAALIELDADRIEELERKVSDVTTQRDALRARVDALEGEKRQLREATDALKQYGAIPPPSSVRAFYAAVKAVATNSEEVDGG